MFKWFADSIRKGNDYRLEKYGPPDTIVESFVKARAYRKNQKSNIPKTLSMFANASELDAIDKFKSKYHFWDGWTGSRYERIENPNYNTPEGNNIVPNSICKSNPVTGYWEAL